MVNLANNAEYRRQCRVAALQGVLSGCYFTPAELRHSPGVVREFIREFADAYAEGGEPPTPGRNGRARKAANDAVLTVGGAAVDLGDAEE